VLKSPRRIEQLPLTIHFLNVGQGDSTIIEFPSGRLALLDINNGKTLDASTRNEVLAQYRATRAVQQQNTLASLAGLMGVMMEQNYLKDEEAKTTDPIAYLDHWFPGRDFFRVVITHPDMDHMTGLHRLYAQTGRGIANFWHSGPYDFNLAATTEQEWNNGPYDKRDWDTYKALRASVDNPKNLRWR
jgi:competence protein ComEC